MKTIVIIGGIVLVALAVLYFTLSPTATEAPEPVVPNETSTTPTTPPLTPAATEPTTTEATPATPETGRMANPEGDKGGDEPSAAPAGKIKADVFTGTLEVVNTGCFADGECFVEVDGKHVTTLMGWSRDVVGQTLGVEGFGDLESHIGETVEVYAQVNQDGTYTLYGSEGFYVKLK